MNRSEQEVPETTTLAQSMKGRHRPVSFPGKSQMSETSFHLRIPPLPPFLAAACLPIFTGNWQLATDNFFLFIHNLRFSRTRPSPCAATKNHARPSWNRQASLGDRTTSTGGSLPSGQSPLRRFASNQGRRNVWCEQDFRQRAAAARRRKLACVSLRTPRPPRGAISPYPHSR